MPIRYNWLASTGNATGATLGTAIGGQAVNLGDNQRQKIKQLSALVTADAETNTFVWSFSWQVSNDNSTWVDVANGSQNAAAVAFATGTGGADAAVTKVIPAPDAIYAWRYARAALTPSATAGTTSDTYSISYTARTA